MDCDTCLIVQEILSDEIDDAEFLEFTIDNLVELSSYIINGNLNIRIHRDITGLPPSPPECTSGWRTDSSGRAKCRVAGLPDMLCGGWDEACGRGKCELCGFSSCH